MIKIKPGLISAFFLTVFLVVYVAMPYYTSYQIRSAVAQADGQKLASYINYPLLKQNFKQQAKAMFNQTLAQQDGIDSKHLSGVGDLIANAIVGQMLDSYASVEGLSLLMQGKKPALLGANAIDPLSDHAFVEQHQSYRALDQFVISIDNQSGKKTQIVLQCFGLQWKIVAIELP